MMIAEHHFTRHIGASRVEDEEEPIMPNDSAFALRKGETGLSVNLLERYTSPRELQVRCVRTEMRDIQRRKVGPNSYYSVHNYGSLTEMLQSRFGVLASTVFAPDPEGYMDSSHHILEMSEPLDRLKREAICEAVEEMFRAGDLDELDKALSLHLE